MARVIVDAPGTYSCGSFIFENGGTDCDDHVVLRDVEADPLEWVWVEWESPEEREAVIGAELAECPACGVEYPVPVELSHDFAECEENQLETEAAEEEQLQAGIEASVVNEDDPPLIDDTAPAGPEWSEDELDEALAANAERDAAQTSEGGDGEGQGEDLTSNNQESSPSAPADPPPPVPDSSEVDKSLEAGPLTADDLKPPSNDYACEAEGCGKTFKTTRGRKAHEEAVHPKQES